MAIATESWYFPDWQFYLQFETLTKRTQISNSSNYNWLDEEEATADCSMAAILISVDLTKKCLGCLFGHWLYSFSFNYQIQS